MSDKKSPSVMVDAIVERDDKLLLVRRKKDPFKGLLSTVEKNNGTSWSTKI